MKYFISVILVLILVVIVGGLAFYFGQKSVNQSREMTTTPTPTSFVIQENPTPKDTQVSNKIIEGGGAAVFPNYTLSTPSTWASQRKQGNNMDTLTLTKNGYKIEIYQAAFGPGGCTYEGEPPDFFQKFDTFVEILNPFGFAFRRSQNDNTGPNKWVICQKSTDGTYQQPTTFGAISIDTPATKDTETMSEIDQVLLSINKKI